MMQYYIVSESIFFKIKLIIPLTYIYCIELFSPQGLIAYNTGETCYMKYFTHSGATVTLTYYFIATFVTVSKKVPLFRHCYSNDLNFAAKL